ncbi:DUF6090 family protein [Robertkochia flava]|uniref:DUF6090 family protein n=1 Tax=Robertkochia flava TaxID=3447986 RepID=UPI001CCF2850|nr:DUF6090 family protein [Robertkochia marina]
MVNFLRKFRWDLIPGSRIRKYLLYALGEIILVVIGILIALQINTWNNERLLLIKEKQYLRQIRNDLEEDLRNLEKTLEFNVRKEAAIEDAYRILAYKDPDSLVRAFSSKMSILPNFEIFISTRTAFDNMLNSNSIDLIRDTGLRQALSIYYSELDLEYSTQGRVVLSNRKFVDDISPMITTREFINQVMSASLDIPDNASVSIQNDPRTIGNLFQLYMSTIAQDSYLIDTRTETEKLIGLIDSYLQITQGNE